MGERDLGDIVLSWSLGEVMDDDLYRGKVEEIPRSFMSLDHYFKTYAAPLIEETRSDLCSCLELISEAPISKILSMEEAGKSGLYFMDVDFWDNGAGFSSEAYTARNGDIFILSSMKPESADDLNRYGVTYCLAMVTEVSMDDEFQKGFRVKVAKDVTLQEGFNRLRHAIFLNNIMTNLRIWKAICFDMGMNNNFTVIKSLFAPTYMDEHCLALCTEQLLSINLNQSQVDAIESVISAVQCRHLNLMKLIWGPPGTGKTKTVSALLWALACLKCRTLTCAPTNVAIVGVCTRFLHILRDFNKNANENFLPFSLGDVLLFGNKYNMDITEDLQDVFLDCRADELVECFSSLSGWRYRIASMASFFEDCGSQYDMLLEDDGRSDPICFLDFIKTQFDVTATALKKCIMNLLIHLPRKCFSHDSISNISMLFDSLEKVEALLHHENLTDDGAKRGFGFLSIQDISCAKSAFIIEKELNRAKLSCLQLLEDLERSLDLPTGRDRNWIQNYCMRNATLIFCTSSSSYRLHHMEIAPLDVLIVDEAAQVCKEAGFGISLFERLVVLDFEKHLLNIQYRMDPCISLFPNVQFYGRKILDGPNVMSSVYNKDYTNLPFGTYAFINISDGREEKEGTGNSWRNLVEVAVVLHLIQTIFKTWKRKGQMLSIGVISPYSSQVDSIESRLGKLYDTCDGFHVRVKSVDGFQGEEDDIIILSTVRSNVKGIVGFLADEQRTNVALTRARHCLWILGNANTLYSSGTVWKDLIADAQRRKCIIDATNDAAICKLVLKVKNELDELDDLLNADSAVFSNTRWKVVFSDEFKKSFAKLKYPQLRREVLQKLIKLGVGWRTTMKNLNFNVIDPFQLAKVYKVRDLYLVWSTDIEKSERYVQIIRIWDLLSHQNVARTVQRLENLFSMYTDEYLDKCRRVKTEGKLEVPVIWDAEHDIIRYRKVLEVDAQEDHDHVDISYAMENSKVSESFLLMKFYSLSSGVAKHLLTATDGSEIDIPFELTDEEQAIIRFPLTSFILGRSGTGKTTVLTMKLIQIWQQSLIASRGLNLDERNSTAQKDLSEVETFVKQVFITVSPKLCSAIRNQICKLTRYGSGDVSDQASILQMPDMVDDLEDFTDIPDSFIGLPCEHYPLTITFRKFLMMLDGTCKTSFFGTFCGELRSSTERGYSKSRALQAFIEMKEVTYEKFSASYWPHFNSELTKKLDASTVFTEIISHIKGGYQANKPFGGKLERLDYLKLSEKRFSSLNSQMRERVYDIFLDYESMKCTAREFDLSDFVNSLHRNLLSEGYNGDIVDCIYIDEVQDLTMTQIALLKYVCRNFEEGFVFAGDTAQTIARGIDFRFEDIRSLFYTYFLPEMEPCGQGINHGKQLRITDMFQLTQNFRTHCGILRLAHSIMSLLYYFFPSCVDKLNPEIGLVYGEAPVLLESGNDENAIMTIFGESKSDPGNLQGFGAEQVILVRDDATKKQVVDLVGKQALVLTIVECKGLEFQDVLLYNFFSSSPLRNKWRVVYDYMKGKNVIESSEEMSHSFFDKNKHYLLCSELKQLYVAITRTRQRLWICENADDNCRPMFDYWKKLCLVEVRVLDSSLIEAMQAGSSTEEDWRQRGTKLFAEGQYEMATMCFEKAGDAYREKLARAAGLLATADRVISTNFEMGQSSLQKASEIFESIGKHKKAATCYMKLGDYKKAGMVYMEKCGNSRLKDAGDCFELSACWSLAADAYFRAKCYAKCLSMCSKGKLFQKGLLLLQQLEEHLLENSSLVKVAAIRNTFLEDCALHYFECGDIKHMMPFVKSFSSMDHIRVFLNSKNLVDELLSVEMDMGNFVEAAGIAKHTGNVLLEADLLEKAGFLENATQLILLQLFVNSLWASHSTGWPPKRFAEKEQLLAKAKEMSRNVSESFYCLVCSEADALSDEHKSLASITYNLIEGNKCGNLLVELIASRLILDVHLQAEASGYCFESEPGSHDGRHCKDMLVLNQISLETLVYDWNYWSSIIVKVLRHLDHPKDAESNDLAAICEDLCAKYFGWRKDGDYDRYVVLNTDSSWLSNTGRNYLQQDGRRCWLDTLHCHSCAKDFWINELYSVGLSVLKKLESIVQILPTSSCSLGRTILVIYEIAKFLKESEFGMPKNTIKYYSILCERRFFELVFLVWRDETPKSLLCILDSATTYNLLSDSICSYLGSRNNKMTHSQVGRITMLLLHAARLDDSLISQLVEYLGRGSEWATFFLSLKKYLDNGVSRDILLLDFKFALDCTYKANWRAEHYISPICYVDLIECLGLLATTHLVLNDYMFCTKSLLAKMMKCRTTKGYFETCMAPSTDIDLGYAGHSARCFIYLSVKDLLGSKRMIVEWVQNTSTPTSSYVPILLRLVITLYLVTVNQDDGDLYEVTAFLEKNHVFTDLPPEFSEKIRNALRMKSRTVKNFMRVFADALAAIGTRMVVMGDIKKAMAHKCQPDLNADMISSVDLSDAKKVMALLSTEKSSSLKQEPQLPEIKSVCNKICNATSGHFPLTSVGGSQKSTSNFNLSDVDHPLLEKFEAFQVNMPQKKNGNLISQILRSPLSWIEQRAPPVQMLELRHICKQVEEQHVREKRALSVKDLHSNREHGDGEKNIGKIVDVQGSQSNPDRASEWSGCSDDEQETGGSNVVQSTKEAPAAASSGPSSKNKPQKKKKSKKSKRSSRK
uniref:UvrD-like helicase ATP-binding domain-containing protein n=1 Tax=Oryza nivara TaxID=4536 RepID=A0A0E0H5G8_ORYNI